MPLQVELVSPERVLLVTEASMVVARTLGGGDIAFLSGHAPFVGALDTWVVEIVAVDGTRSRAAAHGGFISIMQDRVTILSDLAELSETINASRAEAAAASAEAAVGASESDHEIAEATAALARAHARLRAANVSV